MNINKLNKKTFFISYLTFIILIIIILCSIIYLGKIERTGFLSNFDHILENKYYFRLKFESKVFKNNNIYTVKPNTNEKPNKVLNIRWTSTVTGNLVADDTIKNNILDKNYKINNIKYKLKVKKEVYIFLLLLIILFPILYFYIIPNIYNNYKAYIFFLIFNTFLYLLVTKFILPLSSIISLDFNKYDLFYTYIFIMTAYNLLNFIPIKKLNNIKNIKIILTIIFNIMSTFSFFVIESIALTVVNMVVLFSDIANLYISLINVAPIYLKIITIIVTIIYFFLFIMFTIFFIFNLYKTFKEKNKLLTLIMVVSIIFTISFLFFKQKNIDIWGVDFIRNANRYGIINTINYRINYDRINNINPNKESVLEAINLLKEYENKRDIESIYLTSTKNILDNIEKLNKNIYSKLANNKNTNLIYNIQNNSNYFEYLKESNSAIYNLIENDIRKIEELKSGLKRNVFLIFLESFYDYSHFISLFEKDPFPEEYREWASNSSKICPNINNGSFYARLAGLTGSSPLYPKTQSQKIENVLPDMLAKNGYYTLALEEALNTYNLKNFYPSIGIKKAVFGLGVTNINEYLKTNINNLETPLFITAFTLLGHTDLHLPNDLNIDDNNKEFMNNFKDNDKLHILETLDNSVMSAIDVIKIRDTILEYDENALIIFKHDHLYPYLKAVIKRSSIDENIKNSFLNDYKPNPILIWDGTNGAYKIKENFAPENIPLFIAANLNIDYTNSIISLLYKEIIENSISTYNNFYYTTNNSLMDNSNISNTAIFKYENAQRILSHDIFQGKKYYYSLIKEISNK